MSLFACARNAEAERRRLIVRTNNEGIEKEWMGERCSINTSCGTGVFPRCGDLFQAGDRVRDRLQGTWFHGFREGLGYGT
jgi:hypothetical protein